MEVRSLLSDAPARAAIVLATAGRPDLVPFVLRDMLAQTRQASEIVVAVPDERSLPVEPLPDGVRVVFQTGGLTAQRNAGIAALIDADFVFFFDDDAVIREDYLAEAVAYFLAHPDVVGLTGRMLIDGLDGAEVPQAMADHVLAESLHRRRSGLAHDSRILHGCNFAFRVRGTEGIRFDERLPLYSWLEDHDFARRLLRVGTIAKVEDCVIVHRRAKSGGRQAHTRLGYSQFMNPAYLHRAGSFPLWLAVWEILRPCGMNVVRSVVGPETDWRRERLRGNLLAARDAAAGRFTPERIRELG